MSKGDINDVEKKRPVPWPRREVQRPYREPPRLEVDITCPRVSGNWWTPNPRFVDDLAQYLQDKKVLEVFAGNGYLAGQLAKRGVSVTATTVFAGHDGHEHGLYHDVQAMEAVDAVCEYRDTHDVLLMAWPTVTRAAAVAAAVWGSQKDIVFIGERTIKEEKIFGGCADDEFHEYFVILRTFDSYTGNMIESAAVGRMLAQIV